MASSEGKKNGRRLFSFDTLSRSSPIEAAHSRHQHSKPSLQHLINDEEIKGEPTGSSQETWTGIDLSGPPLASGKSSSRASSCIPERKRKPAPLRSTTPDAIVPTSSSRKRWEQLRQHVLPVPSHSNTPPVADLPPVAFQTLPLPTRSQTPVQKPSRLARLGFRHVVEHAREVDESRKTSQEFEKVCWAIRMAEPQKMKVDPNTTGSSLHLTFMSHTSLASDGTSILERHPHTHKKHDLRRPQSVQSLTTYRNIPTVKPLCQLLLHHATPSLERRTTFSTLPHESLVLSTLLIPFLSMEESPRLEEERWNAIEAFETITRSWAPHNEEKGIERYLWCCKAAIIPPGTMRTRILSILWGLIIPTDNNYVISTPQCFQTLAQGLFSLLPHLRPLSSSPIDHEEVPFLMDVISRICDGCCGELEAHFAQEEYGTVSSAKDDKNLIREAILFEALTRCLEDCTNDSRVWLFQHVVEQYWIKSPAKTQFTPLLSTIYARTLSGVSRALVSILSVPLDQGASLQRAQHAVKLIQSRLILDMDALGDAVELEARMNIVKAVLELVCIDRAREPVQWGLSLLHTWYRGSSLWKSYLNATLQDFISKGTWPNIILKFATLIRLLSDDIRKSMVTFVLPLLYDRLVEGPPPFPCIPLTNLLDIIAQLYPQVFYKPLFLCAASSKEITIINHLCIISIVSKFLPDFWIRDAEMVSVALMSDSVKKAPEAERKTWTKQKLGQAVVMLELIAFIQSARHEKEAASSSNSLLAETVKFVVALEARLAILLEAKERTASLAMSRRLLFCVLLREMRLLTRSLKPTLWLAQIVRWCIDIYTDDGTSFDPEEEQKSTTSQIQGLYAAAQDGIRSTTQRRSTMVLSKSLQKPQSAEDESSRTSDLAAMFAQREPLITSISKGFVRKAMKLLVTMSTLLTQSEYRRLASYLWDLLQDDGDASLTAACAEKTPMDLLAVIEVNLQSSDEDTKLNAVHKIGILFNWRYQIISPHIIADRARRPFKAARGPLSFVSTDIGSTAYIRKDDPNDVKDNFPAELRKRLAEIGWNHDDAPVDQHQEWIEVPISLLSSQQLDRLENIGPDIAPPPSPTMLNLGLLTSLTGEKVEDTGLLRRSSSTGGPIHMLKRRAVFVPSLTFVFPRLASLVFDPSLSISSAARSTMLDIMRNDPTLISRPVLDLFAGEQKDIQSAVVTLNAFLHVQRVLPYPMSHFLFNNVAGFLKWTSRQSEEADALQDFAHVVPILTHLVTQVSGLSVRDIRRAKIEPFLIPSGSLWFPSSAPSGPMFPRSLGSNRDPFENLPSDLVSITIIRVSQNMLLLAMLKRNRHDVQLVRKSMSRLELPTITIDQSPLELADFVPFRGKKEQASPSLTGLSIMLSRSYILLVAQVFRSMSRHLNDRNELAVLVDGLNRVLLVHGDDIGIVSQVIIALMVASTRFRRLFTSGGGYVLFMPVLLKVYTESQGHPGIKLAIEYGANRFYALHQESFVFQTLDILAHVTALPHIDVEPLVKSLYNLFFALRKGVLPSTPDAAGIHNANRVQEREALIMNTAEGEPQTFLTLLRRNQAIGENQHLVLELPEEYETNRLGMDDFVRLFLTVIAHDSSIIRAEQFLRLLRILTPHLYHASSNARAILQGGIDALAILLMKTSVKLKASESSEGIFSPLSEKILENRLLEKSRSESNIMTMRLDFLALLIAFVRAGGLLSLAAMLRTTELIRTMLKEVPMDINYSISNFIPSFIHASFMRESPPPLKVVVTFLEELSPLIANYSPVVDFSSAFQTISELVASSTYSSQPQFSRAVVSCICVPALLSCEMAASSNILMSLPSRFSIVTLIAQCIFLRGANVIAEVEKRIPSYDYLAGVVLPLVFSLKTEAILDCDGQLDTWHRDAIRSAWIRLLSFTMSTCRTTPRPLERSRSQDRRRSNDSKRPPPPFLIALQIIKVIIVRVGLEISSRIPSIWLRLRAFLVDILANGNASFATNNSEMSTFPSPTHSPRSSVHLDPFQSSVSSNFLPALHPRSFSHPRIIDYSLWSFLEILCIHRNPLVLQMRLFVMEKLVELDHDLRHQHHDPRGRRISTSVFSKPRREMPSPTSPDSSPLLNASQSSPQHLYPNPSLVSLEADRQPGYNVLSSPHNIRGPKIVHLGPISAFGRTLSPGRGGKELNGMTTTTKIKSVALACATYRRIRTVQKFMGYEDLLPMPQNQGIDGDDMITTMWTQREVLDAIRRETQELLKEFEESDPSLEDGGGLVNPPQMGPP
ncbi:Unc-80 like protein [Termitomyces sp. T112]|nr:Unc-80 like protein [Termitomyces sp. T112]